MPWKKKTYKKKATKKSWAKKPSNKNRSFVDNPKLSWNGLITRQTYHNPVPTPGFQGAATDIYWTSAAGWIGNAQSISIQLSQFTRMAYAQSFDQYRIKKCTLTFIPRNGPGGIGEEIVAAAQTGSADPSLPQAACEVPTLIIAYDPDGAVTLPASEPDVMAYANHKILVLDKKQSYTFYPRLSYQMYTESVALNAFAVAPKDAWVDCASTTATYYGIQMFMDPNFGNGFGQLGLSKYFQCSIYVTADIELRNVL